MDYKSDTQGGKLLSDEEIVTLYWQREESAIRATDLKYGKYLYTIAYNILRSGLDSEECLNDTYLGAWNSMPPNKPTLLHVFLSKITRNISLGRLRKRTAEKRIPPELILSLEELDDGMCFDIGEDEKHLIRQLSYILNDYLATLSDRHVFVFVCRYYYSDSIESIAKMLGLSTNTISRDLSKIRAGLKERLAKEGY
ncbi:MAG: sigma-70 family RNA polymerase sigma factor [Clostridia bacterium]|nr:sigma-70 family RNA polymerase sigma factor [Clostridia bacterium]